MQRSCQRTQLRRYERSIWVLRMKKGDATAFWRQCSEIQMLKRISFDLFLLRLMKYLYSYE